MLLRPSELMKIGIVLNLLECTFMLVSGNPNAIWEHLGEGHLSRPVFFFILPTISPFPFLSYFILFTASLPGLTNS